MQVFYFTEKLMFLICGLFCSFTSGVIGALRESLNLGNRKICWRSWGRNSSAVYKRRLPSKSVDSLAKANHTCPAEWFITSWILNYHKFCHQWSWSWCNKLFLMTFGSDHAWLTAICKSYIIVYLQKHECCQLSCGDCKHVFWAWEWKWCVLGKG